MIDFVNDEFTDPSSQRISAEKALLLRHTALNDCECGGRAHMVSFCDDRNEKGTIWTYDIFCTNPDCHAYFTLSKMVKKGESSFDIEEEAIKGWNSVEDEEEEK